MRSVIGRFQRDGCPQLGYFIEYRGWADAKTWGTIEQELTIEATSDRTGHATLRVELCDSTRSDGWRVTGFLTLDVMERERLAGLLPLFFRPRTG